MDVSLSFSHQIKPMVLVQFGIKFTRRKSTPKYNLNLMENSRKPRFPLTRVNRPTGGFVLLPVPMSHFILAIAVFLLAHVIPAYKPLRNGLATAMGERVFLAAYGTLSTVLMIWLFWAYFQAPYVELWETQEWMRWVPVSLMPVACVLAVAGLTSPNPLSISLVGVEKFDEARPGIVALSRHPAIYGLILWSAGHIVPNGDLAAVLMFALLTLLGLYGPISLDMKRRDRLGEAEWGRLAELVKSAPLNINDIGIGKITVGLVVYAALLFSHEFVIGVAPILW